MEWVAVGFAVLFIIRVLLDPRTMRAGVYLLLALSFLAFDLTFSGLAWTQASNQDLVGWVIVGILGLAVLTMVVLAVMLILNGVTMWRREGRRLSNLLSLLVGFLFIGEIIWAVAAIWANSDVLLLWTAVFVMPTAYFAFGYLAYTIYSALYQFFTRRFGRPVHTVVVLGSGLVNGEVPPLLASRLERGKTVMERSAARGCLPLIVVSGGKGSDESRSEAAAMADYLVEAGVEPDRIVEEDRSRNTRENIANTEVVLKSLGVSGRVAVVTNNFHAFRSALLMRQAKMPGYVIGAPTASYYWPSASIREFVAILRDHPWFTIIFLGITWLPVLVVTIFFTLAGL